MAAKRAKEKMDQTACRLGRERSRNLIPMRPEGMSRMTYNVLPKPLNAANHGVPQKRERSERGGKHLENVGDLPRPAFANFFE